MIIRCAISRSISLAGKATRTCLIAAGLLGWSMSVHAQSDSAQDGIQDLRITVESGDTFTGILSRELQSLDAWGEVASYNKLLSPDNLKPGEVLVIPADVIRRKNFATVVFVKGIATHLSAETETEQPVTKGAKVFLGDMIETDRTGFVSISFNGGSSVNIQPESTMTISLLDCTDRELACKINLKSSKGQLGLDVRNVGFSKPTVFSIDTPYASAAVRGTKFDFDIDDGNSLGVTEGEVAIALNGVSNNIPVGKGVLAGEGRSINDVFDLLGEVEMHLNDDKNFVSSQDLISWNALTDADRYLIAYATSEGMQDVVSSLTAADNMIRPDLSTGDYFISSRGVASNGLRGFTTKKKISLVSVDETVTPVDLNIEVSGTEMRISAPDASAVTEVRVGNELKEIDSVEYLVSTNSYMLDPGQDLTIPIDLAKDWFVRGRSLVAEDVVSPYGFLYVFESPDR